MKPDELRGAHVLVAGAGISGRAAAEALLRLGARVTVTRRPAGGARRPARGRGRRARSGCPPTWRSSSPGRDGGPTTRSCASARRAGRGGARAGVVDRAGGAARPRRGWRSPAPTARRPRSGCWRRSCAPPGADAVACGNIGHPVVTAVGEGRDVLAVELSSFQLHWSPSVVPGRGVRAERRRGPPRLARLDGRLRRGQGAGVARAGRRRAGSTTRPPRRCWPRRPPSAGGRDARRARPRPARRRGGALVDRAFGGGTLADVAAVRPGGPSGLTDALAAAALARANGVRARRGRGRACGVPAGRAPRRRRRHGVDGVSYVDDSKATNPHAPAALAAVPADSWCVWIAGGLLKGARVDALVAAHGPGLRAVVVIGTDRAEIVGRNATTRAGCARRGGHPGRR